MSWEKKKRDKERKKGGGGGRGRGSAGGTSVWLKIKKLRETESGLRRGEKGLGTSVYPFRAESGVRDRRSSVKKELM